MRNGVVLLLGREFVGRDGRRLLAEGLHPFDLVSIFREFLRLLVSSRKVLHPLERVESLQQSLDRVLLAPNFAADLFLYPIQLHVVTLLNWSSFPEIVDTSNSRWQKVSMNPCMKTTASTAFQFVSTLSILTISLSRALTPERAVNSYPTQTASNPP